MRPLTIPPPPVIIAALHGLSDPAPPTLAGGPGITIMDWPPDHKEALRRINGGRKLKAGVSIID